MHQYRAKTSLNARLGWTQWRHPCLRSITASSRGPVSGFRSTRRAGGGELDRLMAPIAQLLFAPFPYHKEGQHRVQEHYYSFE